MIHSLITPLVLSVENVVTYIQGVHNYTVLWRQASGLEVSSVCFRSSRKTDKRVKDMTGFLQLANLELIFNRRLQ